LEKELIIITGRKENAPGQPLIYATSKNFMDYFGINSPADLPQLGDVASQEVINPTIVGTSHMVDEDMPDGGDVTLAINDLGEIVVAQPLEEKAGEPSDLTEVASAEEGTESEEGEATEEALTQHENPEMEEGISLNEADVPGELQSNVEEHSEEEVMPEENFDEPVDSDEDKQEEADDETEAERN
jgi:segregation and condensation protein B